ncbi:protein-tyrosine sulfotransferase [Dorcoceras hygrometricum]|uniref:Protein-tyrosine sulfotransferase n=1 Tax=Dorcoceras hygrometricum TaxID=472368 RepID=A0A2Z6ZTI8_9LAMI|nr:protein-tyrosine sulfotransferase [Dorcoceras hygrometricum]
MAGLPFINQDILYLESAYHQEHSPALKFSSLADHEQGEAQARSHQIYQQAAENMAMTFPEHRAQENESLFKQMGIRLQEMSTRLMMDMELYRGFTGVWTNLLLCLMGLDNRSRSKF